MTLYFLAHHNASLRLKNEIVKTLSFISFVFEMLMKLLCVTICISMMIAMVTSDVITCKTDEDCPGDLHVCYAVGYCGIIGGP